jgi:hypothetical protein
MILVNIKCSLIWRRHNLSSSHYAVANGSVQSYYQCIQILDALLEIKVLQKSQTIWWMLPLLLDLHVTSFIIIV